MTAGPTFPELMQRLRAGDDRAAALIFHEFARRLVGLARSRLDAVMARKTDPESVVQSVFLSFFARQAEGRFELTDWDSLWGLLARITVRKCGHRIQHYRAARRDVGRETAPAADESSASWEAIARDPTPSEAAALTETVEQLLAELNERDRQILVLSLQGSSVPEISERVGYTERTVYRVLGWVRQRLEQPGAE
jgi:RNA polymerase sigma-70 factor (ECF subfamily)